MGVIIKNNKLFMSSDDKEPHTVSEVICVKCGHRWIAVRPSDTLLKELECPNCGRGFTIETGQDISKYDMECDTCNLFHDNHCSLGLDELNATMYGCGYKV